MSPDICDTTLLIEEGIRSIISSISYHCQLAHDTVRAEVSSGTSPSAEQRLLVGFSRLLFIKLVDLVINSRGCFKTSLIKAAAIKQKSEL